MNLSKQKKIKILLIVVSLLAILIIIRHREDEKTCIVTYGEIFDQSITKGIFIREEIIQTSPLDGVLEILTFEGERMPAGSPIVTIENSNEKKTIYSIASGTLSFSTDGWEELLKSSNKQTFKKELFNIIDNKGVVNKNKKEILTGQPLFRIVDNFTLYLLLEIAREDYYFQLGERICFKFPKLDDRYYWANVEYINRSEELCLLKMETFVPEFLSLRQQPVTIIKGAYSGLLIPASSLVVDKGNVGVWVVEKNAPRFKLVRLLGKNKEEAIVEGLNVGDEIYKKPPKDI